MKHTASVIRQAGDVTPSPGLLLQRQCACGNHAQGGKCAECSKGKALLQRQAVGGFGSAEVPTVVHDVLRSPGRPLEPSVRTAMEPRFSHDFSNVKVHTDSKAAESARAVNALAFTVGSQVVFAQGQYRPESAQGRHLIAHELAHVVQQADASGPIRLGLDQRLEAEADTAAASENQRAQVRHNGPAALAAKRESYAEIRKRVVEELGRPMPVILISMIADLDDATRARLAEDKEVKERLAKLPTGARLRVQRYLMFGRKTPATLMDLERAAEEHDMAKLQKGLDALKKEREAGLDEIEVGNIKEKIEYEFRGTPNEAQARQQTTSALEFDWQAMLKFARQSKTLRDLEAAVMRRHQGLQPGKGAAHGGTYSNPHTLSLVIEPNVSIKGAVVRYAHELQNLFMDQDYDQIKQTAASGGYKTAYECAKAVSDKELSAIIIRERVASELGFVYSPLAAELLKPPPPNLSAKEQKKVKDERYEKLRKQYAKPITEGGKEVLPGYERMCRGWMPANPGQKPPAPEVEAD